ncbi:hypothetical protein EV195_11244 [Tenacibaculum skagerrakense]|uniref:Uncharacterized protein n=1 Tax=Tenacibaculum skagerrakense TaxID=186571 RepID=A0A4R2NM73_9FLAO|nr:hypothetical protein [Tenacibaculum skagerrakense]TCP22395.1 hypothetical protein EV195_11244 [Tenacibaculum skagerrakense]
MKKEKVVNSLVSLASLTAGAAGSRLAVEHLPVKNTSLKRWGLVLGGIAGASVLDRKSRGRKIGQDIAISVAVTQAGYLLKDWLGDKFKDNKIMAQALGNPTSSYMGLDSSDFLASYTRPNYDFIAEDVAYEDVQEFAE